MRVLLTGATGFVGRAVVRAADGRHELVRADVDLASHGFDAELPDDLDAVVHLAQSRRSSEFPGGAADMTDVNVRATARLVDHCARTGVERFVFASTATVYRRSRDPLAEDAPLDCAGFYPATKRAAELLIGPYRDLLRAWVLRLFTVYGDGQRGRLVADLVDRVQSGRAVEVVGDRGLLLSPIHVADVAETILAAVESDARPVGPLNVGGAEAIGIREMAATIAETIGRDPVFEQLDGPDPGGYVADREAFAATFNELPDPRPFRQGVAEMLK